jgi:hypothetical protein
MKPLPQLLILCVLVASLHAEEPHPTAGDQAQTQKLRPIAATAARGVELLQANDYEGFLREILPPADWRMVAENEKLRVKILRRVKSWDDEITMLLRDLQERAEEDLAFNGDRTEVGTGHVEHLEGGKAMSHAIALRRIDDRWYLGWVQREQEIFVVWTRDRERSSAGRGDKP